MSRQESRRAIEFYEQQLEIVRCIGDAQGEGNALGNMGLAYFYLRDFRRAVEFQEQRVLIARRIGDARGEGEALFNIGLAYAGLGDEPQTRKRLQAARDIFQRLGLTQMVQLFALGEGG